MLSCPFLSDDLIAFDPWSSSGIPYDDSSQEQRHRVNKLKFYRFLSNEMGLARENI